MQRAQPFDVVVVGAGLAGLTAAARASELGAHVAVLERGEHPDYPCNSRYAGGVLHVAFTDPRLSTDTLREAIDRATAGHARSDLAALVAGRAPGALAWIAAHGATLQPAGSVGWQQTVMVPTSLHRSGLHWRGMGTDATLRGLARRLRDGGATLQLGCAARELLWRDGAVGGVRAERASGETVEVHAGRVVLADGGFHADAETVAAHISPDPSRLRIRGAPTGLGSALRMAGDAGAELVSLSSFYGHLLSRDAVHNDALWPHPTLDAFAAEGIVVLPDGRRFVDERLGGIAVANAVARLPDPLAAVAIADRTVWEGPAADPTLPAPNPDVPNHGGTVHRADDLDALAAQAGIDPGGLARTVEAHNAAAGDGGLTPIARPPYYAIPLCAGITFTTGGVLIDAHAQALDGDERPIEGLYAVGACTGGLEGGPAVGYVGGLMKALVTGLTAGEHVAAGIAA